MSIPPRSSASSLVYRMAASAPKPKPGIEEAYKTIRNRLRKYSATSIVDMALQIMWNPPADPMEELRSAPWLTLLIAKWALQDNSVSLRVGPPMPVHEMNRIRQELWELQGRPEMENIFLMLRSLMHVQLEFQRGKTFSFLRWPALYARLPPEHKSRQQFRQALGMEPSVFLDLSYSLYAAVLNGEMPFKFSWLSPWRAKYGEDVDRIYEVFAKDLPSLREELQSESAQRIRGKHELYEFPYFKRFPLLRLQDGRLHCWHKLVFARGIEDMVHLRLSEQFGKDYTESFSRVFESYVTELAADTGIQHMTEAAYKAIVGGTAPAVEVILECDDCNVFIEAKMSLFADDVLLQDNQSIIFNKTKRVRDGIGQGWRVGSLVRKHAAFGSRFKKGQDYLLVVTSRELLIGGGEMLKNLYAPGKLKYLDVEAAKRMPLTNVFILSIEEFENLTGCVKSAEVNLPSLLKEAAIANQNGATSRMFMSDFLRQYTRRWSTPAVMEQARREAEARMLTTLGNQSDAEIDDRTGNRRG